jgi:hypothetical protein
MSRHDETQEAIAAVRMAIDNDDTARHLAALAVTESEDFQLASDQTGDDAIDSVKHWKLGAPNNLTPVQQLTELFGFPSFEISMKTILTTLSPDDFGPGAHNGVKVGSPILYFGYD